MQPGDKVVCIDATIEPNKAEEIKKDFEIWITKDKEYTIREILDNNGIVPGLLLDEVHNLPKYFKLLGRYQEPAFATWRFRKLNYSTKTEAVEAEQELVEVGVQEQPQKEKAVR
ncbi:MAG: hypothetical protein EOO38_03590 [Cytophagaceae bacterium]|nr:MAG: hypothetical protein EOO38_03590 [Cytophagaceae bacterium]